MQRAGRWLVIVVTGAFIAIFAAPERPVIPVSGALPSDWNTDSFWYEPWGRSGVHKGIDIFAPKGRDVIAPTYGLVMFQGNVPLGGKVVLLLGPKLRFHYFAHLESASVFTGLPVETGRVLGQVGDSGNAQGKPPHLHYAILSLVPYAWKGDMSSQGWKKAFFIDPGAWLQGK